MLKKIFNLCAIACLACTFVACGGPGEAKKDSDVEARKPAIGDSTPDEEGDDTVKSIME